MLTSLSSICNSCKDEITMSKTIKHEDIIQAVLKECQKNDKEYKRQAIMCLGTVLKTFSKLDSYAAVKDLLVAVATMELEPEGNGS